MSASSVAESALPAGRLPPAVRERVGAAGVIWLTTVTDAGEPSPTPVWSVLSAEDEVIVFSSPEARKVGNIRRRPRVTVHLNCDPGGREVTVVTGKAFLDQEFHASAQPGYLEKYGEWITRRGLSVAQFDLLSPVRIRIVPDRVWLGAGRLSDTTKGKGSP